MSVVGSCSACGIELPPGSKFCAECGTPVQIDDVPQAPATEGTADVTPAPPEDSATPKKNGCGMGCLGLIIAVVVLVIIGALIGGGDDSSEPEIGSDFGAYDVCQQFVDERLKAPSTSDYPSIDDASITHRGRTWEVVAYVDAENGFGANIRVPFTCTVTHTGGGNYRLVDVSLIE